MGDKMNQSRKNKRSTRTSSWDQLRIVNSGLWVLTLLVAGLFLYNVFSYNILAFRYLNILVTALLVGGLFLTLGLILAGKAKKTTLFLLVLGLLGTSVGTYVTQQLVDVAGNVNRNANYTEFEMAVYVKADSPIQDIKEISSVAAPTGNNNADDLMALVEEVKKTRQHDLTIEDVESYAAAYQALQEDKTKAIVLNSTFEDTVARVDADYAKKLKKISSYKIRRQVDTKAKAAAKAATYNT